MPTKCLIQPSTYRDSVTLMAAARELTHLEGVADAAVVMATPTNKAILEEAGLLLPEIAAAGPNDLVVVVRAESDAVAADALDRARQHLERRAAPGEAGAARAPRTLRAALRAQPGSNLAVISVSGEYAAAEAWDALLGGLHVLLFSDNVALADEVALKKYASEHNLLLMGPGCGTAILDGVALGFANVVPRGLVGIVAAAGTGLQEVSTLLARMGIGVSQGIGTGGRDLHEAVGGITMRQGIRLLQEDPQTQILVLVSKPPAPAVAARVLEAATTYPPSHEVWPFGTRRPDLVSDRYQGDYICPPVQPQTPKGQTSGSLRSPGQEQGTGSPVRPGKPVVICFLGGDPGPVAATGAIPAQTLQEAAYRAVEYAKEAEGAEIRPSASSASSALKRESAALHDQAAGLRQRLLPNQRYLRGLFSGGTLLAEAQVVWQEMGLAVRSNAPLDKKLKLAGTARSQGHCALDLGEEEFTVGRPHPMIDQSLRIRRLLQEAADPEVAVLLLDVVLGYGAHPDPAAELGPAISRARSLAAPAGRGLLVVASVTGTEDDPQCYSRQVRQLEEAGAVVASCNAAAARLAGEIVKT